MSCVVYASNNVLNNWQFIIHTDRQSSVYCFIQLKTSVYCSLITLIHLTHQTYRNQLILPPKTMFFDLTQTQRNGIALATNEIFTGNIFLIDYTKQKVKTIAIFPHQYKHSVNLKLICTAKVYIQHRQSATKKENKSDYKRVNNVKIAQVLRLK